MWYMWQYCFFLLESPGSTWDMECTTYAEICGSVSGTLPEKVDWRRIGMYHIGILGNMWRGN